MTTRISERYFEKPKRLKTQSGIPVKETYTPDDVEAIDYATHIGDPGQFPYTRGVFRDMYRGRMWSLREICGYASPRATNKRIRYLFSEGESAINIIPDMPTQHGIDSDHPRAIASVGVEGTPYNSLLDWEIIMEGIPVEQVSMTQSGLLTPPLVMYLGVAEKQGIPLSEVRGTLLNDGLAFECARFLKGSLPQDIAVRTVADALVFCYNHAPKFYPLCVGSVAIRESGATAAQEIGWDFCLARHYMKEAVRRGADIDWIAPRVSFTHRCGIDIFEEAAKFRAARKVWARMMKEEFGAKNPRSLLYKVHVVTKGSDLYPQQAEINIVRIAYQALAAVLGGVQSMHTTSFDEPIGLPTEESVRIAVRTQQILAYETGVVNVADPLGGSYYVEALTKQLEEEMTQIIEDNKETIAEALASGQMMDIFFRQSYEYQHEVESGERTVVGVNSFTIAEEAERPVKVHEVSEEEVQEHLNNLRELKRTRDNKKVKECLEAVRKVAAKKEENVIPAVFDAVRAYATFGEIQGAIRLAYGYDYDPFGEVEYPF